MAKRKGTTVLKSGPIFDTVEIPVKVGDATVKTTYDVAGNPDKFKAMVASLTGTPLADAWKHYAYGVDLHARQLVKETTPSTTIKVDGVEHDLMLVPLDQLIPAVNGAYAQAILPGQEVGRKVANVRRLLLEQGKAKEIPDPSDPKKARMILAANGKK